MALQHGDASTHAGLSSRGEARWILGPPFTTGEVPAVALGVLERRLSVHEVFHIQMA
jgi:hypothetical protein